MSDTQEARDRHRQTLALEALVPHVKKMAEALDKLNRNFAGWVRDGEDRFQMFAEGLEGAEIVKKNEANALQELNEKIAPEGYEFKKEGE